MSEGSHLAEFIELLGLIPQLGSGLSGCRRRGPQETGGEGGQDAQTGSCVSSDLDPPLEACSVSISADASPGFLACCLQLFQMHKEYGSGTRGS